MRESQALTKLTNCYIFTGVTKTRKSKPSEGASVQEQQTYQVPSHIGLIKAPNVFNYHNESSFLLPFIFLPLMQQATVGSWLHIRPSQVCFLYWCWLFSSSATGDLHTPPSAKDVSPQKIIVLLLSCPQFLHTFSKN